MKAANANLPEKSVPQLHAANGHFALGNPGRPRGSRNKLALGTLAAIGELSSQAVNVLRNRLNANDLKAAIIVLKYVLPEGRVIELPSGDSSAWADAMAAGEITPDEASRAATALGKLKDVAELGELRARLDEIEVMLAGKA